MQCYVVAWLNDEFRVLGNTVFVVMIPGKGLTSFNPEGTFARKGRGSEGDGVVSNLRPKSGVRLESKETSECTFLPKSECTFFYRKRSS